MDLKLSGKIALVSGSTGGIGLAIVTTLAEEGATVIVNGRTQERVNNAIDRIQQSVPNAKLQGIAADLGTPAGVELLLQKVPEVNILVNNLGIYGSKAFEDISDEEWMNILEVNVMSGVRLSRHYLPLMLKQDWGRIIFISSESALNIPAEMIHYGVTKTAQLALSRGLAETTVGSHVTVNTVLPGPTRSEGVEDFIQGLSKDQNISIEQVEKEFFTKMRPSSLIQRFASTSEVAALVAFVASPLASAINGAALRVEGGVVRSIV
ncbi:MAG: SDR family oxidoreductase [Microcoleus sp. PH2017_29_MFU_D_A]|uniref:SDR family NAD(P)-dependent oxidoreductase n=1 Tax=unclassified Microcoleus TaxID=2642155 RepID=UPI001D6BE8BF|nr:MULTISPECIES: SDR family oxidoreductase [unclassified Microcoleus]MCC3417277.1 SDR family oxidoreductase [Microcoleus sp. PH2017_07_MST_O_A]MCC3512816.1 SDR family oxidoreductase [Microcoleus sp. PH2017_17_BER_D_A]TAE68627.1 MAG: SDR family oxidoreductase [Oscillatoriales cyanobacterium]MCC3416272.1 SDR family oxidoreductase [Microcoleus sp. PH2017_02_FOX_O_A]MCC3456426.1 SDR family oxidoreductase [Microcoleus sp. PH2017_08_TRC_O_A]